MVATLTFRPHRHRDTDNTELLAVINTVSFPRTIHESAKIMWMFEGEDGWWWQGQGAGRQLPHNAAIICYQIRTGDGADTRLEVPPCPGVSICGCEEMMPELRL